MHIFFTVVIPIRLFNFLGIWWQSTNFDVHYLPRVILIHNRPKKVQKLLLFTDCLGGVVVAYPTAVLMTRV